MTGSGRERVCTGKLLLKKPSWNEDDMSFLKSIFYSLKEARFNPVIVIHSSLYAATVTYLRVLKHLVKIDSDSFRKHIGETYHSKVVRLNDAGRLITINRNIELRNLDQVLPYKHAKNIILNNPNNIAVYECPCRGQKKDPCRPTDVCLVVGDPFVDLVRMFQPFRSRRIHQDEALRILKEEDERGHVHTAWFKLTMLDRFYAICNCCKCCCLGMKFMAEHKMKMLLPSGYRSIIGEDCVGCGECAKYCQFDAMEMISISGNGSGKRRYNVIRERCFGCGICESKCNKHAISLVLDSEKGIPLDIEALGQTSQEAS
jgi:ferredoxin